MSRSKLTAVEGKGSRAVLDDRGTPAAQGRWRWVPANVHWLLPLVAALACLAIALPTLGAKELWYDEAFSVTSTNQLGRSLWQRSGSMGLYYVLLTPWSAVSLDAFWLRLPSALIAAGAVALTCRFAMTYFGTKTAIWSGVIMVPSFGVIRYAQEARSYSLVMMLAVASWYLFFSLAKSGGARRWVAWGLVHAALVYSHPLAGLIPATQFIAMRAAPEELRSMTRRSLVGWATLIVCLLPMLATFGARTQAAPGWVAPIGWSTVGEATSLLAGSVGAAQILLLLALIGASAAALTHRAGTTIEVWHRRCLVWWLWGTPAVIILISISKPTFVARYLIGVLPAAVLLLALLVARLPRTAQALSGAAIILLLVPGLVDLHRASGHQWGDAAAWISGEMTSDGARHGIVFNYDEVRQPFEVNGLGLLALRESVPLRPSEPWGTLLRYHDRVTDEELSISSQAIDVLWEVAHVFPGDPALASSRYEWLDFCPTSSRWFAPGIDVTRFDRC